MKRPKIGIVMGHLEQPRLIQGFEFFLSDFDVNYYVTEHAGLLSGFKPSGRLWVFDDLKDMPGYLRGLEEHLTDCDLLIGVDASRLPTFQMIRIARKYKIASAVIASEYHPFFYANFPNIRAIQMDVFEHADRFWPLSKLAEGMLKIEGVKDERIHLIRPYVDVNHFHYSDAGRKRFRDYIGLNDDDILFLYHGELHANYRLDQLLSTIRVLKASDPHMASRIKLLFVGEGPSARELKYICHDYRLGNSVLFLHQDPQPFIVDLYSASDLRFVIDSSNHDVQTTFPLNVLESSSCGVIPIVKMGSHVSEFIQGHCISIPDYDMHSYVDALSRPLNTPGWMESEGLRVRRAVTDQFSSQTWVQVLSDQIRDLLKEQGVEPLVLGSKGQIESFRHRFSKGERDGLLAELEAGIKSSAFSGPDLSVLWQLKGDILREQTSLEPSMAAYEVAIQIDETNFIAYRGLGYLAFKSHSHEDAMTFFRKALAKRENDVGSLFGIALVHRRLALHEEALFWLERCIDVEGLSSRLVTMIIQTALETTKVQGAIDVLERIIDMKQASSAFLMALGQLYMKIGKVDEGTALMSKAEELDVASLVKTSA